MIQKIQYSTATPCQWHAYVSYAYCIVHTRGYSTLTAYLILWGVEPAVTRQTSWNAMRHKIKLLRVLLMQDPAFGSSRPVVNSTSQKYKD